MSMLPPFFGRAADAFEPLPLDVFDPFQDIAYSSSSSFPCPLAAGRRPSFPSSAVGGGFSPFAVPGAAARVDWKETPAVHVFKADLPGMNKGEVKVEVDGRVLQISGERTRERDEKTDTWHRTERSSGKFLRRFALPGNAMVDQVTAAMQNGVLTVTVPKEEAAGKPNVRSVEISG